MKAVSNFRRLLKPRYKVLCVRFNFRKDAQAVADALNDANKVKEGDVGSYSVRLFNAESCLYSLARLHSVGVF